MADDRRLPPFATLAGPPPPPRPGPDAPIAVDVACRKCAYNLRGIAVGGRCPECGTAAGYSLRGDLLQFCDPGWVATLFRGARVYLGGMALVIAGFAVMQFLGKSGTSVDATYLGYFALMAGGIVTAVGWWMLTRPDPSGVGEDQYGTSRKLIRFAMSVGVVESAVGMALMREQVADGEVVPILVMVRGLTSALRVVAAVGLFAQLAYLGKLARRIPDAARSGWANFLFFAYGGSFALVVAVAPLVRFADRAGQAALTALGGLIGIGVLVFGLMYLLLIESLARRFRDQADLARAGWAAIEFAMPLEAIIE